MNITKKLSSTIRGKLGETVNNAIRGVSSYFEPLQDIKNKLTRSLQAGEAIKECFMSLPDLLTDNMLEAEEIALNKLSDYQVDINLEGVDALSSAISQAATVLQDTNELTDDYATTGFLTINNVRGDIFNFIVMEKNISDNVTSIISTNLNPSGIEDSLVYKISDKYYFNPIIKTANYIKAQTTPQPGVYDDVMSYLILLCGFYGVSGRNIVELITNLDYVLTGVKHGSILEAANSIQAHYSYPHQDTIFGIIKHAYLAEWYNRSDPITPSGTISTIWDVLSDYMSNVDLLSYLKALIDDVINRSVTIEGLIDISKDRMPSTQQFAAQALTVFKRGGIFSLARFIIDQLTKSTKVTMSGEGLIFTDASTFMPVSWLSGAIAGIGSFIGTIIQVIGYVISPVVGLAFQGISSLANNIFKLVDYNFDTSTNASIVDNENTIYAMTPYAPIRGFISDDELNDVLDNQFSENSSSIIVEVVGGYLIIGKNGMKDNNNNYNYAFEFHPSILDHSSVMDILIRMYCPHAYETGTRTLISLGNLEAFGDDVDEVIMSTYKMGNDNSFVNNSDGYCDRVKDLTSNVITNTALFMIYYLHCMSSNNISGSIPDSISFVVTDSSISTTWDDHDVGDIIYLTPSTEGRDALNSYPTLFTIFAITLHLYYGNIANVGMVFFDLKDYAWQLTSYLMANLQNTNLRLNGSISIGSAINIQYNKIITRDKFEYFGYISEVPTNLEYCINVPKYNRRQLISEFVLIGAVLVASSIVIATTSISFSKWKRAKRLQNIASVEQAWSDLTKDPSDPEKQSKYIKTVKKNNLYSTIFGGTKFSKTNYWDSGDQSVVSQDSTNPYFSKAVDALMSEDTISNGGIEAVIKLITG